MTCSNLNLILLACVLSFLPNVGLAQVPDVIKADPFATKVYGLLSSQDAFDDSTKDLIKLDSRAFDVYEIVLNCREASNFSVMKTLAVLINTKSDSSRFRQHTIRRIADSDSSIRLLALKLLARIGTSNDTVLAIALLNDSDGTIVSAAAITISKIGGPVELIALDAWLLSARKRLSKEFLKHIEDCREKLQERIAQDLKANKH